MSESRLKGRWQNQEKVSGPIKYLNPTTKHYPLRAKLPESTAKVDKVDGTEEGQLHHTSLDSETRGEALQQKWRSRDNRKGESRLLHPFSNSIS